MNTLHKSIVGAVILGLLMIGADVLLPKMQAQAGPVVLTATTLSAAQTLTATTVRITTSTGVTNSSGSISAPTSSSGAWVIYVDREAERVTGGVAPNWTVQRGWASTARAPHANSAKVWFGLEGQFQSSDPPMGACTSPVAFVPWINVLTGNAALCISSAWVWTNPIPITYNSNPGQTSITP